MTTFKDMCELIEKANKKKNFIKDREMQPIYPTAMQIWEYNSAGEIYQIPHLHLLWIWYEYAKKIMEVS